MKTPDNDDTMTVRELCDALSRYPPDTKVFVFVNWEKTLAITSHADQDDGTVLLGEELPDELHVRDYRYEDA